MQSVESLWLLCNRFPEHGAWNRDFPACGLQFIAGEQEWFVLDPPQGNRMKRAFFVALGAMIALQPVQVSAQLLQGGISAQEYLQFLKGSGVNSTWGPQVGEYEGRFNASATRVRSPRTTLDCSAWTTSTMRATPPAL